MANHSLAFGGVAQQPRAGIIIPGILGNSSFVIGQAVLTFQGTAGNIPLAAAFTVVPIVIMILYLLGAKQLGAFEAL